MDKQELACYRNTLVQLLALYIDPESRNAQTDNMMPTADHTLYCVAVRSANKEQLGREIRHSDH